MTSEVIDSPPPARDAAAPTTRGDTMTEKSVDRYLAFWNTTDAAEQERLASVAFTEDVGYHAPVGVWTGAQALIDFHDEFLGRMPDAAFVPRQVPDRHHDRVRVQWEIVLAGERSFATGTDVLVLADDGRIASVTTFLDRPPAGFQEHHAATA
jgi:hypothetical protein